MKNYLKIILLVMFAISSKTFAEEHFSQNDAHSVQHRFNKFHRKLSTKLDSVPSNIKHVISVENIKHNKSYFDYICFDQNFEMIYIRSDYSASQSTHCLVNNLEVDAIIDTLSQDNHTIIKIIGGHSRWIPSRNCFAKKSETRKVLDIEAKKIYPTCKQGEVNIDTYFQIDTFYFPTSKGKYSSLISKVLFEFSTFKDSIQDDSVKVTFRIPNVDYQYAIYKCSKTLFNEIVQQRDVIYARKQERDSLRPKAVSFIRSLRNRKKLSPYFAKNWTFVYKFSNPFRGAKAGTKKNLSPKDIDRSFKLFIKQTDSKSPIHHAPGYVYSSTDREDYTTTFNLNDYAKNWQESDQFKEYENSLILARTREFSFDITDADNDITFTFTFDKNGKIVKLICGVLNDI